MSKEGHPVESPHTSIGYIFLPDWRSVAKMWKKGCASLLNQWKHSATFQWKQDTVYICFFLELLFFPFELGCVDLVSEVMRMEWESKRWKKAFVLLVHISPLQPVLIFASLWESRSPTLIRRSQRQTMGIAHCSLLTDIGGARKTFKMKKKKIPGVRILGTRVSCSYKFSFCGGLLKTSYNDKNHSGNELFLFEGFADGWYSRYITFMTTSWSNVTHLETASQACSTEGCDDALLWFFQLLLLFFSSLTYTGGHWKNY